MTTFAIIIAIATAFWVACGITAACIVVREENRPGADYSPRCKWDVASDLVFIALIGSVMGPVALYFTVRK